LFIVVAIAGLVFGEEAATGAIAAQLAGLMGQQSADLLQSAIQGAAGMSSGVLATAFGIVMLVITASGVFTEMQQSLNVIWKAVPPETTISGLLRARAVSLGLVGALGFLLLVSLVISAILTALGAYISAAIPLGYLVLRALDFILSFTLITILFAAIYKVLPDKPIAWRDVLVGALVTALLFTMGKFLIGLYLGSSTIASSYGAAGGLIIALLWVYYSAQIFLLGAEFTKVYAHRHGSRARPPSREAGYGSRDTAA
jgi:membrane protein